MSPRDEMLRVRFSKDELEILQKAAEDAGYKSMSAFVRAVTVGEIEGKKGMIREIRDDVKEILRKLGSK